MSRWRRLTVDVVFALKIASTAAVATLATLLSAPAVADSWQFGLIGDIPYSERERRELPRLIAHLGEQQMRFIAHIGDIKSGGERCDDALYTARHADFDASTVPFVYVPGDNEWTDCDRLSNGGYEPVERLQKLRSLFWTDDRSLGRDKLALERQSAAFPEHARFRLGPVLFITLNVPGSDNNYGSGRTPSPEFRQREPAMLAWLKSGFALAKREGLAGVVVLMQANPGFKHFAEGLAHRGYRSLLETLRRETLAFAGPVAVVHGDTHWARVDHPLRDTRGKPIARFTRVETYGYPVMGWIRGTIDTATPELFRFELRPWPGQ